MKEGLVLMLILMFWKPSLMILNIAREWMLRGTGGRMSSFLSKMRLGFCAYPASVISICRFELM